MPAPTSEAEAARRWAAINAAKATGSIIPYADAAKALGLRPGSLRQWAHEQNLRDKRDDAVQAAMDAIGTQVQPGLVWVKTKGKDGEPSHSVLLKPRDTEPDLLERLASAFSDIPARDPIQAPPPALDALLTLYPLFDMHFGMMAWGRETGSDDYDLKLAADDLHNALAEVMAISPNSEEAILLVGGDFFHADDNRAETPANRHKLDVDGRQFKVTCAAVEMLAAAIDTILAKHAKLQIRVMRGNHDEHSHLIITHALAQRYRLEPRCMVEMEPRDLFMRQWGTSGIFANHGDKGKAQQMLNLLCDVVPFWSNVRHRHFISGHIHQDTVKDFGALRWESIRAFCPPDSYGARWPSRRQLQSMTFHKERGVIQRNYDPIQRAA